MNNSLDLVKELINLPSVTPEDAGCQELLIKHLAPLGFSCETLISGNTTNLWAKKGKTAPLVVFAGHTDVVPTGPLEKWTSPPFTPTERDGMLYGRGTTDMKAAIAAFVVATKEFMAKYPKHPGSIAFLITSDEEGPATDGTVVVCDTLTARGEKLDYCIVGEPSSTNRLGDTMKNGRRGSLHGHLTIKGKQGHIAYPQLAKNPIHLLAPALAVLVKTVWDQGNQHYQPTSWQISNIHSGAGAKNVIPDEVILDFNFRFAPVSSIESLKTRVHAILDEFDLQYDLEWAVGALPFFTQPGTLSDALAKAILKTTGLSVQLSTSGGTSDGRFISTICSQVIEFGPPQKSAHMIDEHIELSEIEPLKNIYLHTLENLLIK